MSNPVTLRAATHTVTIATGASLSSGSEIFPPDVKFVAFVPDDAWDTNVVSFQMTYDGTTWVNVNTKDALSGEYATGSVVKSTYTPIDIPLFYGACGVKVRSGTSASAVNQSGATVITLVLACL